MRETNFEIPKTVSKETSYLSLNKFHFAPLIWMEIANSITSIKL